jgi:hypothetical protein
VLETDTSSPIAGPEVVQPPEKESSEQKFGHTFRIFLILLGRTLTVTSSLSVTRETLVVATFYDSGDKVVDASSSCSDPTDIIVGKTPSFEIILVEAGRTQRVDSCACGHTPFAISMRSQATRVAAERNAQKTTS